MNDNGWYSGWQVCLACNNEAVCIWPADAFVDKFECGACGLMECIPVTYEWSKDEYDRLPQITQDARALLQRWYQAMEDGSVASWMPDPFGVRIEMSVADEIVARIDKEFEHELTSWAHQESAGSYEVGPEFSRLLPPQRLALAQQLQALKQQV